MMTPPIPIIRRAIPYLMWLPSLFWVLPPVAWALMGWGFAAVATIASLLVWIEIYRQERAPVVYAALYPLGAALVAYIMIRSAWRGARKVGWRGRLYRGSGSHRAL